MDDSEAQEREHFQRIVRAFKSYRHHTLKKVTDKEGYIKSLPPHHQSLLESYKNHLGQQSICIEHNAEIINLIIKDVENMFENVQHDPLKIDDAHGNSLLTSDIEKVQSTIRQIVRDWSPSGEQERDQCYGPIIQQIGILFPEDKVCAQDVNILVPGAGLGRLAYELARRGYACQGNEFSLFMLFASNFVLNKCRGLNSLRVYPWVHVGSNRLSNADQLQAATFPDMDPSDLPPSSQFTMAAGDFLEIYTEDGVWDCVATCFFIDCSNNIVAFIETIYKILKPGGYWVNLGPLLYHFADQPGELSIEPSYDEVKSIVSGIGFKITVEERGIQTAYTQNLESMLNYEYQSVFFVAHKPF
ncbi:carnosine N-methyltransferase-like [Homarus americanus]|uniref:Carnosine N-methyltransferase n=1 Tax=Homarus americanus TaxID=6706 RepID=A0A8J5T7P1_HOMAM|nr:carnosine N-methyltransferase-like [Homarus americanus]XP_042213087.1 carnosine N-methyltransferase-like [Homarus americanus]XP_042213088.1 carnosine N-methyltransferase-like [Homarus americanus]XP_042213089.1 carnosine N-methyltransferase-like [Homarus americanus]KAG7173744.1 Carnosine N-methyltransferase-like [Homarus americanus]